MKPLVLAFFVFWAAPAVAVDFSFLVYGDTNGGGCGANSIHRDLVSRMANENADFVIKTGDMITGYDDTNFVKDGSCTGTSQGGSFKNQIAPLQNKTPKAGLPTYYFPTIGNHDDGWGDSWYPDPYGDGICDLFSPSLLQTLVPNHTSKAYYRDKTRGPVYSDSQFYSLMCSKTTRGVYADFMYYSFDYQNSHFAILHLNNDYYDLLTDNASCLTSSNYDECYNVHELHWLQDDLSKARANPAIKHIFVFMHNPMFTTGYDHDANVSWPTLTKEFSTYRVAASFNGHNHVYERTVPIYVSAASPNGTRDDAKGTTYITTGGGGGFLGGFNSSAWFDLKRDVRYHYMRVHVVDSNITVEAIADNGTVFDQVSLAGSSGGTVACDFSGDGSVNALDLQKLANAILAGSPLTGGDLNKDGAITVPDLQLLVNVLLGMRSCP